MYINNAFFQIVPGNEAKAYAALGALADKIKATEPDTWFYLIHTPDFDPGINIYPAPSPQQVGFIRPEEVDPNVFQVEARWIMKPGKAKKLNAALETYVKAVKKIEPGTY